MIRYLPPKYAEAVTSCKSVWVALIIALVFSAMPMLAQIESQNSMNGFILKKVTTNTTVPSGQNYTYYLYYTIPAGASNVTITDILPTPLTFQAITVSNVCGTPTTQTTPAVGANGTVTVGWTTPPPGGCSGSIAITVQFPPGVTCNQTIVRNRACMTGQSSGGPADFCTGFISTTATANNPWNIYKYITPSSVGNQGGNCPLVTPDSVVEYNVCVSAWGGPTGVLNLVSGVVRDTLPTGAVLQSSTCGMTQSGNVLTWNVGNQSAVPNYTQVCCTFRVLYPRAIFPVGTNVQNRATLSGGLGSAQPSCGTFSLNSNTTCVTFGTTFVAGQISKWVYTNGQPGCSGQYLVYFCNTGTSVINTATIRDTVPGSLTGVAIGGTSGGITTTVAGNIVTATLSSPLNPGQCRYFYITFTISPSATPSSVITNCAYLFVTATPTVACASFTVVAPAPAPCIWKEVCSKKTTYKPGDTLRYRLRVQNIGGLPITGASITDNLNANLQYLGNPSYYTTAAWNSPCQTTSNWAGASASAAGQAVTVVLPTIPASCQSIFFPYCSMYGVGGVPYYFIEFDVRVRDTTALGNVPNFFQISGGSLGAAVTSNVDLITIVAATGYTLNKKVGADTSSLGTSALIPPGGNLAYQLGLSVSPGSAALRHVTFGDALPMSNLASSSDNFLITSCGSRGSTASVSYASAISATPTLLSTHNGTVTPANGLANVNVFTPAGAPGAMFNPVGCSANPTTWGFGAGTSGLTTGNKNLGWYFGSAGIGAGSGATVRFGATMSNTATAQQIACNDFIANGAVRTIINSSTNVDVLTTPARSNTACATVTVQSNPCDSIKVKGFGSITSSLSTTGVCIYTFTWQITNSTASNIMVGVSGSPYGSVTPSPITVTPGTNNYNFTFTPSTAGITYACFKYGLMANNQLRICDSVCYDLPPCPKDTSKCLDSVRTDIKCSHKDGAGNWVYNVQITGINNNAPTTLLINSPQGTFVPTSFAIPNGPFTVVTNFTDLPPANSAITIYYALVGPNGQIICRDSIKANLPKCDTIVPPKDCCDKFIHKFGPTSVTQVGNNFVNLNTITFAGPASIRRFSATIVSSQRRRLCPNSPAGPWERIFGDVVSGSVSMPPAPGPTLLSVFSREAVWGPGECKNWNQGVQLGLRFVFPTPPCPCRDELVFSVRYSYTDCECRTCDTVITYRILRKCISFPWDTPIDIGSTAVTKGLASGATTGAEKSANTLQGAETTSFSMSDANNGTLNIVVPAQTEDIIRVRGIEVSSPAVPLVSLTSGAINGTVLGTSGIIAVNVDQGASGQVAMKFDNAQPLTMFPVTVRYQFTIGDSPDLEYSDPVRYTARVPGGTGDAIVTYDKQRPANVRTYALTISNTNSYKAALSAVRLTARGSARILAVGSEVPNGESLTVLPSGSAQSYTVNTYSSNANELSAGSSISPVYITVSGAVNNAVGLDFETFDTDGNGVSTGSIDLSDPLTSVENGNSGGNEQASGLVMGTIAPNPATGMVTLSYSANQSSQASSLIVYDIQGREVLNLFTNKYLESGNHITVADVSSLTSGVYRVVLRSNNAVTAQQLTVVK